MSAPDGPIQEEDRPDLLTARQAADLCGINPGDLRRRVVQGVAPPPDVIDATAPPQRRNPRWLRATIDRWDRVRHRGIGRYPLTPRNLWQAVLDPCADSRTPWAIVNRRTAEVIGRSRSEKAAQARIDRMGEPAVPPIAAVPKQIRPPVPGE